MNLGKIVGHYITNSLEEGKQIVFQGHPYWTSVYQFFFSAWLFLLMAIGLLVADHYTSRQELCIVSILFFIIATIIHLIIGREIVRTKSEFAVTNTGSIELVDCGGTFHRVEYIENPLTVRKVTESVINKNRD